MAKQKQNRGFYTKPTRTQALTERELKFGYWFVTHKDQLRKAVIIFLIVLSAGFYGYAAFSLIRFYGFRYQEYQQMLATAGRDYLNIQGIHQRNAIQPIEVVSRQILPGSGQNSDIVVRVRNPNTKWSLDQVSFQFSIGGQFLETQEAYILPGEEKYLTQINVEGVGSGTPQIFFEDEQWRRVTLYEDWGPDRLNFLVTNKQFLSARQSELSGQLPISEVRADITNATAYNYRDLEVQLALYSGNNLAAVSKVVIPAIPSGSQKSFSTRFTQGLPPITQVEVIPTVNLLDESSYMQFEGDFDPSYPRIEE